jgi:hypothetical protein
LHDRSRRIVRAPARIIGAMTERGLPSVDGAPACPFVAFEDDRESRSTSPDHRHRCYAEPLPAPRAAAHQEAYCLSSAFPVCPTFQDWAKREAARARGDIEAARPAAAAGAAMASRTPDPLDGPFDGDDEEDDGSTERSDDEPVRHRDLADRHAPPPFDEPIRRNPPRDWAAPPPWAAGGGGASASRRGPEGRGPAAGAGTPEFLAGRTEEGRGLAGSAADRLASGGVAAGAAAGAASSSSPSSSATGWRASASSASAPPDAELADLVGAGRPAERQTHGSPSPARPGNRPRVSSTRSAPPRDAIVGPAWERSRRYEAYPTIRTRVGLPQLPRIAVLAAALAIAAIVLFFLPALLLDRGGGNGGASTAGPSASQPVEASSSVEPSVSVAPSAQVYVVKAGDTMSKIAARYGLKPDELCAANKATITNCDKIAIGDELVIPTTAPEVINDASAEPSAS